MEDPKFSFLDESRAVDKFPEGMRVLAVDDNPTCLKVLENLLRKCHYHVTTTNQAIKALQMLRENQNNFDLVISDVNMPDMDGFKLLEQVGLEMDLPVIMLSAHSDTNLVMNGVKHGAVDYLLKPVRIEELKNIWQHVIRKKKSDSRDKAPFQEKAQCATGDSAQDTAILNTTDQNGKSSEKRKDRNEDEDLDESDPESDDPSTQKKARVVWSIELHGKFVAAVKQLGLEKAVPKKILDLMKVEGLTRENVASHLQKYRLFLKRIHTEETQQAHMITAMGGKDSSFMRIVPVDGFRYFRGLSGRPRSSTFTSYTPGAVFHRLDSPAELSLHGIAASGLIQPGQSQSLSSSMDTLGKNQPTMLSTDYSSNLFQGIPTSSLELNQLQQSNRNSSIGRLNPVNDSNSLTDPSQFPDNRVTVGCSSNSLPVIPSLLDYKRCNESWHGAAQPAKFPSNSLPLGEPYNGDQLAFDGINFPSSSPHIGESFVENILGSVQCHEGFISNVIESESCMMLKQSLEDNKQEHQNLGLPFNMMNASVSSAGVAMSSTRESLQRNYAFCSRRMDDSLFGQLNEAAPSIQISDTGKLTTATNTKHSEPYFLDQMKSRHVEDNFGSLDDIMSAVAKQEEHNRTTWMNGEFGLDAYPLPSCI